MTLHPTPSNLGLVILQHEDAHLLGLSRVHPQQVPDHLLAQRNPPLQGGPVLEGVLILPEKTFIVQPNKNNQSGELAPPGVVEHDEVALELHGEVVRRREEARRHVLHARLHLRHAPPVLR